MTVPDEAATGGVDGAHCIAAGGVITEWGGLGFFAVALAGALVESDAHSSCDGSAFGIPFQVATVLESGDGADGSFAFGIIATRASGRRGLVARIAAAGAERNRAGRKCLRRADCIPSNFAAPGVEVLANRFAACLIAATGTEARDEAVAGVRIAACQVRVTLDRVEIGDHDA